MRGTTDLQVTMLSTLTTLGHPEGSARFPARKVHLRILAWATITFFGRRRSR